MKTTLLLLLLAPLAVHAQPITMTLPAGCSAPPVAIVVTCTGTPPPTCVPYGGTYPNCTCIPPQVGTPPNCTTPGGGGGNGPCTGYRKTVQATVPWTAPPTNGNPVHTQDVGGMGANDAFVVQFTTKGAQSSLSHFNFAEYGSPQANRIYKLSTAACDFAGAVNGGTSVGYWFSVGPTGTGAPELQPNTTYYVNIHNDGSCTGSNCNIIFSLFP